MQVKDVSHVVILTSCKRTYNQYETNCGFRPHPRECPYASGSIIILSIGPDYQYHNTHHTIHHTIPYNITDHTKTYHMITYTIDLPYNTRYTILNYTPIHTPYHIPHTIPYTTYHTISYTIYHTLYHTQYNIPHTIPYHIPYTTYHTLDYSIPRREHITVLKSLHGFKIQDRITYTILMLTYKSYCNIAPTYLCELISRRESSVNTRLGSD